MDVFMLTWEYNQLTWYSGCPYTSCNQPVLAWSGYSNLACSMESSEAPLANFDHIKEILASLLFPYVPCSNLDQINCSPLLQYRFLSLLLPSLQGTFFHVARLFLSLARGHGLLRSTPKKVNCLFIYKCQPEMEPWELSTAWYNMSK